MAPKSPTISKTSHIALLAQGEGQTPTRIRYLSPRQVRELTSLSERTLGRLAERGKFPQARMPRVLPSSRQRTYKCANEEKADSQGTARKQALFRGCVWGAFSREAP
jgi:hypothetical protein